MGKVLEDVVPCDMASTWSMAGNLAGAPRPILQMDEWEQHAVTHCPFSSACEHCVKGRAIGELHRRRAPQHTEVEIDWTYWPSIGQAAEDPTPGALTTLTAVHRGTGMLLSTAVEYKWTDTYGEQLVLRWLLMLGLTEIKLRMDGEPASRSYACKMVCG
eukprot:198518-Amphidinium_carterae.2